MLTIGLFSRLVCRFGLVCRVITRPKPPDPFPCSLAVSDHHPFPVISPISLIHLSPHVHKELFKVLIFLISLDSLLEGLLFFRERYIEDSKFAKVSKVHKDYLYDESLL